MGYSSPLSLATFWENIRFAGRPEFELMNYKRQSMDGGGNIISSKAGQPKWRADVTTANGRHRDDMDIQALIKALLGRDMAFLAYDIRRPFPKLDPGGVIISGATVQIRTVGTDNRSLSFKGLPANFPLSIGDPFVVADGTGKRARFEIVEAITASGSTTAEFEVQPFLPTWMVPNLAVDLHKPASKFKIVTGSYKPQSGAGNASDGISFSMISVP